MKLLDLFSGIGGFSLGLEKAGFETIAFAEIDPYCRAVLKKNWPDVYLFEDVKNVTAKRLRTAGLIPDVISAGFPCQDISQAGKQAGLAGSRSGLWSECARILGEVRPDYAVFENVTALLSGDGGRWFQRVLFDISAIGYHAEWHCIRASTVGAQHNRDRVWIICHANSQRKSTCPVDAKKSRLPENIPDAPGQRLQRQWTGRLEKSQTHVRPILSMRHIERFEYAGWQTEPQLARVVDGLPDRAHRVKAIGNAVVPQIPEIIGGAILEHYSENKQ